MILAVDGKETKGADILRLLKGVDTPGSVVELTLRRTSGETETVKLQRMARDLIADKKKLFDLFTHMLDRGRKDKDAELIKYVEEATELWTAMMLEEHDQDEKCVENVHGMQDVCDAWLEELLSILKVAELESSPL